MFSLFSFSPFGREMVCGRGKRRHCKPGLEVLEDRNLLSFWTAMSPMPTARGELGGVQASDGQNYAIGGATAARASLTTVEAYNTSSTLWSTRASMLFARQGPGVAAGLDGRIYAFGGATAFSTAAVTNTAECYSPIQNTWTRVANMPTGRVQLAGAKGSDGLVYAISGQITIETSLPALFRAVVVSSSFDRFVAGDGNRVRSTFHSPASGPRGLP